MYSSFAYNLLGGPTDVSNDGPRWRVVTIGS
jgi:hypothetical protein